MDFSQWPRSMEGRKSIISTAQQYSSLLKNVFCTYGKVPSASEIESFDASGGILQQFPDTMSPSSCKNIIISLCHYLDYLQIKGEISEAKRLVTRAIVSRWLDNIQRLLNQRRMDLLERQSDAEAFNQEAVARFPQSQFARGAVEFFKRYTQRYRGTTMVGITLEEFTNRRQCEENFVVIRFGKHK